MYKPKNPKIYVWLYILITAGIFTSVIINENIDFSVPTTGRAWIIEDNTFFEEFDSITPPWTGSADQTTIYEEFWQNEFDATILNTDSNIQIPLDQIQIEEDSGAILFRVKTVDDYSETDILPLVKIGELILFSANACDNEICSGNYLTEFITEFGTKSSALQIEKGIWYEFLITWQKNIPSNECDESDNLEANLKIYLNNEVAFEDYLCMNEPYPFTSYNQISFYPSAEELEIVTLNGDIESPYFIDILVSTDDPNFNFGNISLIVGNPPYWIDIPETVTNNLGESVLVPEITQKCLLWNIENYGEIIQDFSNDLIEIVGSDLIITNSEEPSSGAFQLNCANDGYPSNIANVEYIISDLSYFDAFFIDNNMREIEITMENNDEKEVWIQIENFEGMSDNLEFDLVETDLVAIELGDQSESMKITLTSGAENGESLAQIILTNTYSEESITLTIFSYVGNNPPEIIFYSPEEEFLNLARPDYIVFQEISVDDITEDLEYKWQVNGIQQGGLTQQNYTFLSTIRDPGIYDIDFTVFDEESLSDSISWTVEILDEAEVVCIPNWTPAGWTECIDNIRTELFLDQNDCGTEEGKPLVTEFCGEDEDVINDVEEENIDVEQEDSDSEDIGTETLNLDENLFNNPSDNTNNQESPLNFEEINNENNNLPTDDLKNILEEPKEIVTDITSTSAIFWIIGIISGLLIIIAGIVFMRSHEIHFQHSPPNVTTNNQKLLQTINWYKTKGVDAKSNYYMMIRMGFDKNEVYNAIYEVYHS